MTESKQVTKIVVQDDSPRYLFHLHPAIELDERFVSLERIKAEVMARHPGRVIKKVLEEIGLGYWNDVEEITLTPWAAVTVQLVSQKALKAADAAGKDGDGH